MESADILIQAGHEGMTTGAMGASGPLGDEIDWTPIVADEATRILRAAGVSVLRGDANFDLPHRRYSVAAAAYIHFDGSGTPGVSGASIGYPVDDDLSSHLPEDAQAAAEWKRLYRPIWPFRFMQDNFTDDLRRYYGYGPVTATRGMIVIELGEISDPKQAAWMKPRLKFLGALVAHFLSRRISKGDVPLPVGTDELLSVHEPPCGQPIPIGVPVRFAGTAAASVARVEILAGPGGPFMVGQAPRAEDGSWSFTREFSSPGKNRPFTFRALDGNGNMVHESTVPLTLEAAYHGAQPDLGEWRLHYSGLELQGAVIPHKGVANPTLKHQNGMDTEPFGEMVPVGGVPMVMGKVSSFGGADDTGVGPDETGALTGEKLRALGAGEFYCAMRWSYAPQGQDFWKDRRILVVHPHAQKAVLVRAIDWGPNTDTGRIVDLSPAALAALEASTDDEVLCAFAKPAETALGPILCPSQPAEARLLAAAPAEEGTTLDRIKRLLFFAKVDGNTMRMSEFTRHYKFEPDGMNFYIGINEINATSFASTGRALNPSHRSFFRCFLEDLGASKKRRKTVVIGLEPPQCDSPYVFVTTQQKYLKKLAEELASLQQQARSFGADLDLVIRYASEMNVSPKENRYAGDPQAFIDSFRIVRPIFRAAAPGIRFAFSPGIRVDLNPDRLSAYWPDKGVDVVAGTWYVGREGDAQGSMGHMRSYVQWAQDKNLPLGIDELGGKVHESSDNDAMLARMFTHLRELNRPPSFDYVTVFLEKPWGNDATLAFVRNALVNGVH